MKKRIIAFVLAMVLLASLPCFSYADEDTKVIVLSNLNDLISAGITKSQLLETSYGRAALTVLVILDLMSAGVSIDNLDVSSSSYVSLYQNELIILTIPGDGSYSGQIWQVFFGVDDDVSDGQYRTSECQSYLIESILSGIGAPYWENSQSDIESVLNELSD